jgi:hypothetical protein
MKGSIMSHESTDEFDLDIRVNDSAQEPVALYPPPTVYPHSCDCD